VDLSICLPLYQQQPYALVQSLLKQAEDLKVEYEILIIDDASSPEVSEVNQQFFAKLSNVRYLVLPHNIGRAKMRNLLASEAKGQFFLSLDADVYVNKADFLRSFWSLGQNNTVLIGGIELGPLQSGCELRWYYAKQRETLSLEKRLENPYSSFMTGAFFCERSIFMQLKFDEEIKGYGHEDTLFGFSLRDLKIPLLHIDNPILIEADDRNIDYLEKSKEALENLKIVYRKQPHLAKDIKILQLALNIERSGFSPIFRALYRTFRKLILQNLLSAKPNLRYFDLYRLNYLLKLKLSQ
tara:strand:- start:14670 stop:15560 length:891 start_codon:yes stop_codon:yes gene_type:complete